MNASGPDATVLVVDDSAETVEVVRRHLVSRGYRVLTASGVPDATRVLAQEPVEIVVTDLRMPKLGGLELIRHVRENLRDTEVVVITGFPSIRGAVEAVKTGADEYLVKPFTKEELLAAVQEALDKLRRRRAGESVARPEEPETFGIIGESQAMRAVRAAAAKAARSAAAVMITGESGTGKELVARAIHYAGPRRSSPFVPVNCGAIPASLIESEMFGHVRGAFTGATDHHLGFFQAAHRGTIFLDEIGEFSTTLQVKLLRVLDSNEVCMVGATRPRKVDVRVVAATNRDLPSMVARGRFREDLFFRLNVLVIEIPPLRERGDDVLLLAQRFVKEYADEAGRPVPRFTDRALETLREYRWPGNVRELQNVLRRLVVMTEGDVVDTPDLPQLMRFSALSGELLTRTLAEVEADHVRKVLARVDGNKTRAAEILGIDRKTLREKLKVATPGATPDEPVEE